MKRILSLILAVVFLLTLAGAASADFSLSGQFVSKFHTADESGTADDYKRWVFETIDDSRIEIQMKGSYGKVTGDIKYRLKLNNDASLGLEGRTANLFYKFSDTFSLGLTWDKSGDTAYQVYQSPIITDLQWEYIDFLAGGKDIALVAKFASGDLAATAMSPLVEWNKDEGKNIISTVVGGLTYNLDPIFIAAGARAAYDKDTDDYYFVLQPSVMYALSDEIRVGGEVYYNGKTGAAVATAAGLGGLYKAGAVMVNGGVYFDFKNSGIGAYGVEAEYTGVPNFKFYTYYYHNEIADFLKNVEDDETKFTSGEKDSIEAGATYYLDPKQMAWVDLAYWKLDKQWYEIEFGVKF